MPEGYSAWSASFSGENWLSVDSGAATCNATKAIVSSFQRTGGVVGIGTPSCSTPATSGILDTASTTINGGIDSSVAGAIDALNISLLTDSDDDPADLEEMIGVVAEAITSMTSSATANSSSQQILSLFC